MRATSRTAWEEERAKEVSETIVGKRGRITGGGNNRPGQVNASLSVSAVK